MRNATVASLILGVTLGAAAGLGGYTFVYARGAAYLTNDPAACANCHVMRRYLDGWVKSSHRRAAVCNDCHTPAGFVGKWYTKASNGFWHSFYFTAGTFPDPLRITPRNHVVAERSCRKCHQAIVDAIESPRGEAEELDCIRCHGAVGHPR